MFRILLSSFGWALNPIIASKIIEKNTFNTKIFALIKYIIIGLFSIIILLSWNIFSHDNFSLIKNNITNKNVAILLLICIAIISIASMINYYDLLQHHNSGILSLFVYPSLIIFSLILNYLINGIKITRKQIFGSSVIIFGMLFVI
jgi:drug/metabolite transporter (DMT)-like permease